MVALDGFPPCPCALLATPHEPPGPNTSPSSRLGVLPDALEAYQNLSCLTAARLLPVSIRPNTTCSCSSAPPSGCIQPPLPNHPFGPSLHTSRRPTLHSSACNPASFDMRPTSQLPTTPMTLSDYKSRNLSPAPKLVTPTHLFLFHVHLDSTPDQHTRTMAPQSHRSPRSGTPTGHGCETFASARRNQEQGDMAQPSAQRPTSYPCSPCSTPSTSPPVPSSYLNKPLPPSPTGSEKNSRKSTALRGFLRREPSRQSDSAFLRPQPYQPNQQLSAHLALDTHSPYMHTHSYTMPSSPRVVDQSPSKSTEQLPRTQCPASHFSGALQHQPYSTLLQHQPSPHQWRPVSSVPRIETTPRSRTFPDTTLSPTLRESASGRPRPHTTCFSPSEPFTDMSQFHLFAEAMTGLPSDSECLSPNGPPQLQGSLFARRSANDSIPLPLQHPQSSSGIPPMRRPQREQRDDWQNFEPPPLISTWSTPALHHSVPLSGPPGEPYSQWQPPPQMDGVTAELELLGLNDASRQDDELPNYQQSQAEMAEMKRLEAAARARELEARWRRTRRG